MSIKPPPGYDVGVRLRDEYDGDGDMYTEVTPGIDPDTEDEDDSVVTVSEDGAGLMITAIDIAERFDGCITPAHIAAMCNSPELIEFILAHANYVEASDTNFSLTERDTNGHTPFMIAFRLGHHEIVRRFIDSEYAPDEDELRDIAETAPLNPESIELALELAEPNLLLEFLYRGAAFTQEQLDYTFNLALETLNINAVISLINDFGIWPDAEQINFIRLSLDNIILDEVHYAAYVAGNLPANVTEVPPPETSHDLIPGNLGWESESTTSD